MGELVAATRAVNTSELEPSRAAPSPAPISKSSGTLSPDSSPTGQPSSPPPNAKAGTSTPSTCARSTASATPFSSPDRTGTSRDVPCIQAGLNVVNTAPTTFDRGSVVLRRIRPSRSRAPPSASTSAVPSPRTRPSSVYQGKPFSSARQKYYGSFNFLGAPSFSTLAPPEATSPAPSLSRTPTISSKSSWSSRPMMEG